VPIDDLSSERALEQLRLEDLSRPPQLATLLPGIATKALSALLGGDITQATDLFTQCQDALEGGRSQYLLRCVIEDLKWLRGKLEDLSRKQQEYMATDWVALLFDADRKARAALGKARIERIAKILCSSIQIEPTPAAEQTEDLMRIAMELTDNDIIVLRRIREEFETYNSELPGALTMPKVPGLTADSVLGICGKLQSLGLVATAEQHATATTHGSYPRGGGFVLLDRAEAFLKFIAVTTPRP
jgi:hypothetical protein